MLFNCFKVRVPFISSLNAAALRRISDKVLNMHAASEENTTAGIIIIGDEILKGTTDVNTPYLIKELNAINIAINKVAIIPDNVDTISSEVNELSSNCSFVLTSGGIGPTHDDVTYEAIAKACNDKLELNQEILKNLVGYFGPESSNHPGIIKYATVPSSAVLNYVEINHNGKSLRYPIVSVRNIFIFPGVPDLLKKSFEYIKKRFIIQNKTNLKDIFITIDEFSITSLLNKAVEKFDGSVKFGSYPTFTNNYYRVKLVLESQHEDKIEEACNFLHEHLPRGSIVNIKKDILLSAKEDVHALSKASQSILSSVSVLKDVLKKYSLSELCMCFNGGKDCTALLHLFYSCVQQCKPHEWNRAHFLYVRGEQTFPEVEAFIENCTKQYNFSLTTLHGDLKTCVSEYLKHFPDVKAMIMGTRRSDPGASDLDYFSKTDSDWPPIIRVLPLLHWTYSDVWYFLRELQLPYCTLYDRGYTSLGSKSHTVQNSSLLHTDSRGFQSYKPAYLLEDPENERKSRL